MTTDEYIEALAKHCDEMENQIEEYNRQIEENEEKLKELKQKLVVNKDRLRENGVLVYQTPYEAYAVTSIFLRQYREDKSLCIDLWNDVEGPIARLTVCLSKKGKISGTESYLDTNNCPWAEQFVEEYNLGEITDDVGFSGFCMYPKVKWNLTELEKYT